MRSKTFISSFILKLLAIIFMTCDHIGLLFLTPYAYTNSYLSIIYWILRILGRFSLPIFAFLLSEGLVYTSSRLKYIFRLAIMAFIIGISILVIENVSTTSIPLNNIFVDLCIGASLITCLELPKVKKLYTLIPLLFFMLSVINGYLTFLPTNALNTQYSFYGVTLILAFYYIKKLYKMYSTNYCKNYQIDYEGFVLTDNNKFLSNIFASLALIIVNLCCWMILKVFPALDNFSYSIHIFSIFGFIFILFYNGKLGYNKKWFKYGSYLYYPLHLIILFLLSLIL
ncbi:MAG: TraX family protein [Bacilli bacterium]